MRFLSMILSVALLLSLGSCASVDSYIKTGEYSEAAELIAKMPEQNRAAEHAKLADAMFANYKALGYASKNVEVRDVERLAYHYRKADAAAMKRGLTAIADLLGGKDKGEKTDKALLELYVEAGFTPEQAGSKMGEKYFADAADMLAKGERFGVDQRLDLATGYFQAAKQPDRIKAIVRTRSDALAKRIEADKESFDTKSAWGKNAVFDKELGKLTGDSVKLGLSAKELQAFKLELYQSAMKLMPTAYEYLLKSALDTAVAVGDKNAVEDLLALYEQRKNPLSVLWYSAIDAALGVEMKEKAIAFLDRMPDGAATAASEFERIEARYRQAGLDERAAALQTSKLAAGARSLSAAAKSVLRSLDPGMMKALAVHYGNSSNSLFDKDEEELLKAAASTGSPETIAAVGAPLVALDPKKTEDAMRQAGVPAAVYAKAFADAMMEKEPTLARAYYLKAGDKANASAALDKMLAQGKAIVERSKGMFENDEFHKAKISSGAVLVRGAAREYWIDGRKKEAEDAWEYLMKRDPAAFNLEAFGLLVDFGESPAKAAKTVMDAAKKNMWTTSAYKVVSGDASGKAELEKEFKGASSENEKKMVAILLHRLGSSSEADKLLSDSRTGLLKFVDAPETEIPNTDAGKLASALFDMGFAAARLKGGSRTLEQLYLTVAMDNILIAYSEKTARDAMEIFVRMTESAVKRLLKLPPTATDAEIDGRIKYGNPDQRVGWVMAAAGVVAPTAQREFARIGY